MADLQLPTAGRLGHLTPEQEQTLAKFKEELTAAGMYEPTKFDDHCLLRFLRARKFNLVQTKKMFEDFYKWRVEQSVDTIMSDFDFPEYPVVRKYYPRFYHKTDKLGRPVYIERLGHLDVKQLFTVTNSDRMLKNHVYEYEKLVHYRLKACSQVKGHHLEQSLTILDLKGVSLSGFTSVFSLVKQVSTIAQNYYPEMLGKMYIINTPMLFTACWSMVKPLLDEVTVKKIDILGSSYKAKLLELIDEENLPDFLGGKSTCEGGAWEMSEAGPWCDGTVSGFPKEEFEKLNIQFGMGPAKMFAK